MKMGEKRKSKQGMFTKYECFCLVIRGLRVNRLKSLNKSMSSQSGLCHLKALVRRNTVAQYGRRSQ